MNDMLKIAEFLLARIEEDETATNAAITDDPPHSARVNGGPGVWWVESADRDSFRAEIVNGDDLIIYDEGGHTYDHAVHIANHNPARVLRDCAAKRAIVAEYEDWDNADWRSPDFWAAPVDTIVEHLAAVYSDHPDYDPAWKVDQ